MRKWLHARAHDRSTWLGLGICLAVALAIRLWGLAPLHYLWTGLLGFLSIVVSDKRFAELGRALARAVTAPAPPAHIGGQTMGIDVSALEATLASRTKQAMPGIAAAVISELYGEKVSADAAALMADAGRLAFSHPETAAALLKDVLQTIADWDAQRSAADAGKVASGPLLVTGAGTPLVLGNAGFVRMRTALGMAVAGLAALAIGACTSAGQPNLPALCQAYGAAAPTLAAADPAVANLAAYAGSVCTPAGTVQPGFAPDAGTPAWLADILTGLKVALPIAAALA